MSERDDFFKALLTQVFEAGVLAAQPQRAIESAWHEHLLPWLEQLAPERERIWVFGAGKAAASRIPAAVWFGIVVVVLVEIGLITPPVGMNVFVLKANLPKVPVGAIFRGLVPFIAVDVVRLTVLVAFPSISLVLVHWMR